MQITPPFGYGEIVPLSRQHRVLMNAGSTPAFCRALNALAISLSEFVAAGRDYPIVFASLDDGRSFAPVVVLGLSEGRNLFVDQGGEWDPAAYLPAAVRRYPFCISKLYVDGEPRSERVVCVAKAWLDEAGLGLFEDSGEPTPRWRDAERLLSGFEADLDRTAQMASALSRLQLLEPFTLQVVRERETQTQLQGMYRVGEQRLRDLEPASLKALAETGLMGPIYAHLHSLENFQRLYARSVADPTATRRR